MPRMACADLYQSLYKGWALWYCRVPAQENERGESIAVGLFVLIIY